MTDQWRKSSHSDAHGNDCVEVASRVEGVGLRDSKTPDGGVITVAPTCFAALVRDVKSGRFDT
jgi:hypothetical protein